MLDMHLRAAVQTSPAAALANSGIAGTDPGETGSLIIHIILNLSLFLLNFFAIQLEVRRKKLLKGEHRNLQKLLKVKLLHRHQ